MQLSTLFPLLLLGLSQVASAGPNGAANGHAVRNLMSSFGVTKRANIFAAGPMLSAHLRAKEASPGGHKKRQVGGDLCDVGFFLCQDFPDSCCGLGTYCVQIGGEVGCCEIGETCDTIICNDTQTTCGDYCCDTGDPCVTSNGVQMCSSDTTTTQVCSTVGYVPCPGLDICCPRGVDCIPPTSCDIPCGPNDLVCDLGGCCPEGTVCLSDNTCGQGSSDTPSSAPTDTPNISPTDTPNISPTDTPNLSSSAPPMTTTRRTTRSTTKRTTIGTTTTEDITSTEDATPTTEESTPGTYTTPKISVLFTTVTPNNAASFPTMGALLGGLGIAAGGYLAM